MEFSGKSRFVPGSQEVIGSTPICSTKSMKQLQSNVFVAAFLFAYKAISKRENVHIRTDYLSKVESTGA